MNKIQVLDFLGNNQPFVFEGENRYSSLVSVLKECRKATQRNIDSGYPDPSQLCGGAGNWLGAIGYFSVLDLIGSTFKIAGHNNKDEKGNSIEFAIKSFGQGYVDINNAAEISAIVALRHAFAHNLNLLNVKPYKLSLQHKFTVYPENNKEVVKLPITQWDGDVAGKKFAQNDDRTYINIFGIGNMTEEIYERIKKGISSGGVELQIDDRVLVNKYTFIIS